MNTIHNPLGDGNCGYRALAQGLLDSGEDQDLYGGDKGWMQVRADLLTELESNREVYVRMLGGEAGVVGIQKMLELTEEQRASAVPKGKWYSKLDMGQLTANAYQRPICFLSRTGSSAFLPLFQGPDHPKSCIDPLFLCLVHGNHWILLNVAESNGTQPIPPVSRTRLARDGAHDAWKKVVSKGMELFQSCTSI